MDKKSLIGLGLIAGILGIWLYISGPSKETVARNKAIKDSVALVQQKETAELMAKDAVAKKVADTLKTAAIDAPINDSTKPLY